MSVPPPPNQPPGHPEQPSTGYAPVHTGQQQQEVAQQYYGHYQAHYQNPAYYQQPYQLPHEPAYDGFSIASLCIGVSAIVAAILNIVFGGIIAVIAIVFGIIGMIQTSKQRRRGRGMAISGLALGIGVIALIAIFAFVIVATFGIMFTSLLTH